MMDGLNLGEIPQLSKTDTRSREELIERLELTEAELKRVLRELYEARNQEIADEQIKLLMQEQIDSQRDTLYGASSERYKKPVKNPEEDKPKAPPKPRVKKPSERYPNIPVREELITQNPAPQCPCCSEVMTDSGMTEDSEQLTVIPKKYEIVRQKRVKFRCSCQGTIVTAPAPPRIIPGSSYSDEMILDVVLSKYCDLIPIERYAAMASRSGLIDLPTHSIIELTHAFADFAAPAYLAIKREVLQARVLNADESPHQMLEGSHKKSWYLWGFSTPEHCFLECHNTRSGDVASDVLVNSVCEVLVTDVYSGYDKAIRLSNEERGKAGKPLIVGGNCNAHARRYFFKAWKKGEKDGYKEAQFYLDHYHEIYRLEAEAKGQPPPKILELRAQMRERFEAMKKKALEELPCYPSKNKYTQALKYFLKNFEGLTLFLSDAEVPIDNNLQERLLRNHVVGRKTWYGTHSERGALTAAILFTLVESCKLNHVNPREYFKRLVEDLHAGRAVRTPYEFKLQSAAATAAA